MTVDFDELYELFNKYGHETYMIDENITQLNHALQAAHIAEFVGAPNVIVLGMLLHDIGQLIGRKKKIDISVEELHLTHDDLAYQWLKDRNFPQIVCDIARYHTAIKVQLCQDDPDYFDRLSSASKQSYLFQKEKYKFNPIPDNMKSILKTCRLFDEMAKFNIEGLSLDNYRDLYENNFNISDGDLSWINRTWDLYKLSYSNPEEFIRTVY